MDFRHIDTENEMVKRIVRSAYEVFALNDFKKASTNMIVKSAGVSRGILYHYFTDKEELFAFLVFLSVERSIKELDEWMNWEEDDVIRRICELSKYRLDVVREYPYLIEFSEKYADRILAQSNWDFAQKWREKFYHQGVDYSKFKDQARIDQAMHMIRWAYKGIYLDTFARHKGSLDEAVFEKVLDECEKYYLFFVSLFY